MKKIETWEDLKGAFRDNKNISFRTEYIDIDGDGEKQEFLFIQDNLIFTKNGNLLEENLQVDGFYCDFWSYTAVRNRTYQQIHDIIKLILE